MINVFYEPFPETITIGEQEFPIVTDFREWFRFADMVASRELTEQEKVFCMLQWVLAENVSVNYQELIEALFSFYRADDLELHPFQPESENGQEAIKKPPLFDWRIDGKYIMGDFRRYYGLDLVHLDYLHWWEFRCLFSALPDESICSRRIAYRGANLAKICDKSERQRIAKIQREIAIPYLTEEEEEFQLGAMLWG